MKTRLIIILTFLIAVQVIDAGSFYVMTAGSPSGNGSITKPWDLQTALKQPTKINAGDTIWIYEGTYVGEFVSRLTGKNNAPIIVRNVPGNRVVIDGVGSGDLDGILQIEGEYAWYYGLIITNSSTARLEYLGDVDDTDGVCILGENNKLINCIIHNCGGNGIGFWSTALDSEIYGCIIYNNGSIGDDRGHGHGIYGQNGTGTRLIRDNILFNSFGLGIHIYSEGGSIQGFTIEGNMMFNNGLPGNDFLERHILVGGGQPADRIFIKSNYLFNRPDYYAKAGIQLGYKAANVNAECSNNYMGNCNFYVIKKWNSVKFSGNSVFSSSSSMQLISFDNFQNISNPYFNYNQYRNGLFESQSFDAWKASSGQDKNSTYSSKLPDKTEYILRKNYYESGRANLVIYNWGKQNTVNVDLSGFLANGSEYKIYDVSNYNAGPISSGTYNGGTIGISMLLSKVELPYGNIPDKARFKHTAPDYGVFLIVGPSKQGGMPHNPPMPDKEQSTPLRILNHYPNPTVDLLSIDFYSPDENRVVVEVVDLNGRIINSEYYYPKEGKNTYVVNLAEFPSGMYMVAVFNGDKRSSCKVIKKDFVLKSKKDSDLPESGEELLFKWSLLAWRFKKRSVLV